MKAGDGKGGRSARSLPASLEHRQLAAPGYVATNLKELGVPDTTIQRILRHENVSTTQRFYIKTASAVAVDAMKKLEEKISGTAVVQLAPVVWSLSF